MAVFAETGTRFTPAQIEALNELPRFIPALRDVFHYGDHEAGWQGFGTRLSWPLQPTDEEMTLQKEVDFVGDTVIYKGWAEPGVSQSEAAWRITRVTFTGADEDVQELFAGNNNGFVHVWNDRASLSYSI